MSLSAIIQHVLRLTPLYTAHLGNRSCKNTGGIYRACAPPSWAQGPGTPMGVQPRDSGRAVGAQVGGHSGGKFAQAYPPHGRHRREMGGRSLCLVRDPGMVPAGRVWRPPERSCSEDWAPPWALAQGGTELAKSPAACGSVGGGGCCRDEGRALSFSQRSLPKVTGTRDRPSRCQCLGTLGLGGGRARGEERSVFSGSPT